MTDTAKLINRIRGRGSSHYTLRCVCGKQITTCRCIGPKDVWEVEPCVHQPPTEQRIRLVEPAPPPT